MNKVSYTEKQNLMWSQLYNTQKKLLYGRVYNSFWYLLNELGLKEDSIPQLEELSVILKDMTGWSIVPVTTGIDFNQYIDFLSKKMIPSTTYIRESIEFAEDPDIFHEIFGHCPLLLDENYSNFLHRVAIVALTASPLERVFFQRLIWFTIEVGLIQTDDGLRVYGASLISSPQELVEAIENNESEKKAFNLLDICRSPYRSDIIQPTYYFIEDFSELWDIDLSENNVSKIIQDAMKLKEYTARFKVECNKYTNVNYF